MKKQPYQIQARADDMSVMIILGNDCGLLAEAMYFLSGQKFREQARLLLPTRLVGLNPDDLDVTTQRYSSFQELVELVEQNSPDIVFLCSGYLLVLHNLLTESELKRFIEHIQQRGGKIVTNEPLAGIMSTAITNSTTLPPTINPSKNYSLQETWILSLFIEPYQSLKHLPHIYPWTSDAVNPVCHSILSFYNPKPPGCHKTPESQSILESYLGSSISTPYWFLTIGPEDYVDQCKQPGLARLVALTAEKIQWISESGRHVVLVLPDEFLQSLQDSLPTLKGLSMFSYLPYAAFNVLNLNAEYAFYWNVTSASAMVRLLHGLPTFHFSIGHIGESLYPVYKEIVRLFFANCEPVFIDQTKPFDLCVFRRLDHQARDNAAKILKSLESLPTSETLIARLRNG